MRSFTMALLGLAVALPVGIATVPAHADLGDYSNHTQRSSDNWGRQNQPFGYTHNRRDENAQRYGWNEHNRYGENEGENGRGSRGYNHEHWRGGEQQFGYNGEHGWNHHQQWGHRDGSESHYGYNSENRAYQGGGYGTLPS